MTLTYQMLLRILKEGFAFVVFCDEEDDFEISDYISDSLMFINFIIAIEEDIGKELPDDFLDKDILRSAKGFAEKLDFFMVSLQNNSIAHE